MSKEIVHRRHTPNAEQKLDGGVITARHLSAISALNKVLIYLTGRMKRFGLRPRGSLGQSP